MSSNFQSTVAQIKEAYNIEDYIANDGVVLKQSGGSKLKGLCPMPDHNERTPSFSVDTQFQNYYCFGCKESGDLLSYVQTTQNLSFWESLQLLASDKGIELESKSDEPSVDYTSLRAILKDTALFYVAHFKKLDEDHPAKKQILDRGLELEVMRFGYAPEKRGSLYAYLSGKKYSDDLIHQSGVCRRSEKGDFYDFWNGRLMFVIADIQGNPIGFSGRKLFESDRRGKYVNSTDTPLFNKSKALFNVSQAKKPAGRAKEVYVVEGQFDVAAFVAADIPNVIAASGTAFTDSHAQTCSRLVSGSAGSVIFAFDGDTAGLQAARRVFETSPDLHTIAFAVPFKGQDPCDFRQSEGSEALQEFVSKERIPLVDFVLENLEDSSDLKSTTGRAKYVKEAADLLSHVRSRPILDGAIRRVALHSVSAHSSVVDEVAEAMKKRKSSEKKTQARREASGPTDDDGMPLPPQPEPEEDDQDSPVYTPDDDAVLDLIAEDEYYSLAARFIAITVRYPKLRPALVASKRVLPSELCPFADDMRLMLEEENDDLRIIPEKFTLDKAARELLSQNFMPHLSGMNSREVVGLYKRLGRKLKEMKERDEENDRQGQIAQVLGSGNATIEDLKRALALEAKLKGE